MAAEIDIFLAQPSEAGNKRNGFRTRTFGIKGLGEVTIRVPRDRAGRFNTNVVPEGRRHDQATEKDLALLHLAGLSTRMLAHVSRRVLGVQVSAQRVSDALSSIVPAARKFLERPPGDRRWMYLYVDGTNFRVRRTTVAVEPTLVVLGVDENGLKSVLSMVQGDKDSKAAWEMVFADLKARGLDGSAVKLGIMDGLPGLPDAFVDAFPKAKVTGCSKNDLPLQSPKAGARRRCQVLLAQHGHPLYRTDARESTPRAGDFAHAPPLPQRHGQDWHAESAGNVCPPTDWACSE